MADRPDTPKSQPHRGLCLIETDRSRIVVRGDPLRPVCRRGRQWAVAEYGIERLDIE